MLSTQKVAGDVGNVEFRVKQLKSGKFALILDREHLPQALAAFGVERESENNNHELAEILSFFRTVAETVSARLERIEERLMGQLGKSFLPLRNDRFVDATKENLRREVEKTVKELEANFGMSTREVYYRLYSEFRQRTGIDVKDIERVAIYKNHPSKLDALIEDGYGNILVEIAHNLYDKCNH